MPSFRASARELVSPPSQQLPALDVLRSAAVLLVLGSHFAIIAAHAFPSHAALFDTAPFRFGWTGVDLFFVLSGFLIGRQLWMEVTTTGTVQVGRFILRRGFRIWPLYVVFVVLSPLLSGTGHYRLEDWTFLSNYHEGNVGGGWSLSTEEQFYIVAPLAIVLLARWVRPAVWFVLLPLLLVGVELGRHATAATLFAHGLTRDAVKTAMYDPFHLHNEGLVVGLFLALVAVHRPAWVLRRAETPVRAVTACALAGILVGLALRTLNNVVFPFLGLALTFGGVMVLLLMHGHRIDRVLRARVFYVLSRLSYGMYLNHFPLVFFVAPLVAAAIVHAIGPSLLAIALTGFVIVVCSMLVSAVLFLTVEQPFLQLRERVMARPHPRHVRTDAPALVGDVP